MQQVTLPVLDAETFPTQMPSSGRVGSILHPTPLMGTEDIPGLNLTRGCGHQCAFCSVRAAPGQPEEDEAQLFPHTAERLRAELEIHCPRAVFLSPGSDPFPPRKRIQEEAAAVIEVLSEFGVESWVMTRGILLPPILNRLTAHRERIRVTVGITTLDLGKQRLLEAGTASSQQRLEQISRLRDLGFQVHVTLEPLIPGLTDTVENLKPLLDELAQRGISSLNTTYLFLRTGIIENLKTVLPAPLQEMVFQAYKDGPLLTAPGLAGARYLPRSRRQRGYATLMALAASRGISVTVSGLTNPDFLSGTAKPLEPKPSLLRIFLQSKPSQAS